MSSNYDCVKKSISKKRQWYYQLKDKPCADCSVKYPPCVMEWHHLNPKEKDATIGNASFRVSRKRILEEIKKCVLLCANCHRLRELQMRMAQVSSRVS